MYKIYEKYILLVTELWTLSVYTELGSHLDSSINPIGLAVVSRKPYLWTHNANSALLSDSCFSIRIWVWAPPYSQLFRPVSDVYTLRSVIRKKLTMFPLFIEVFILYNSLFLYSLSQELKWLLHKRREYKIAKPRDLNKYRPCNLHWHCLKQELPSNHQQVCNNYSSAKTIKHCWSNICSCQVKCFNLWPYWKKLLVKHFWLA